MKAEVRKRKNDYIIFKAENVIELGFYECQDIQLNTVYEIYIKYVNEEGKITEKRYDLDRYIVKVR